MLQLLENQHCLKTTRLGVSYNAPRLRHSAVASALQHTVKQCVVEECSILGGTTFRGFPKPKTLIVNDYRRSFLVDHATITPQPRHNE